MALDFKTQGVNDHAIREAMAFMGLSWSDQPRFQKQLTVSYFENGKPRLQNHPEDISFVSDINWPHVDIYRFTECGLQSSFSVSFNMFSFSSVEQTLVIKGADKHGASYEVVIHIEA